MQHPIEDGRRGIEENRAHRSRCGGGAVLRAAQVAEVLRSALRLLLLAGGLARALLRVLARDLTKTRVSKMYSSGAHNLHPAHTSQELFRLVGGPF